MAPKIIKKISKETKKPFSNEPTNNEILIFQLIKENITTKIRVIKDTHTSLAFLLKRRKINTKNGIAANIIDLIYINIILTYNEVFMKTYLTLPRYSPVSVSS